MMKNPLIDLCSEFGRKARFHLALMPYIPHDGILREMEKEGWCLDQRSHTASELAASVSAVGHGCAMIFLRTVKNPQGQDVFTTTDPTAYKTYREAVKRTAAEFYGITLK